MKKMNKKGFTLIELLAVIVILAIVAAVTMTVIIPKISGQNLSGAETSMKDINKAVASSCADAGLTGSFGTFSPGTFATGDLTSCSNATGCTFELKNDAAATFVRAMNITGDYPAYVKMTVKNCQVDEATICFNAGAFEGVKVNTAATVGTVTSAKFTSGATECGGLTHNK